MRSKCPDFECIIHILAFYSTISGGLHTGKQISRRHDKLSGAYWPPVPRMYLGFQGILQADHMIVRLEMSSARTQGGRTCTILSRMSTLEGRVRDGRVEAWWLEQGPESLCPDPHTGSREGKLGMMHIFEPSKPTPVTHFIKAPYILPQPHNQLGTKYPNIWDHRGHYHS